MVQEINYAQWRDEKGEFIFDDPGAGNYSFAVMAGKVPAAPPPEPPKQEEVTGKQPEAKKTRKEKRAEVAKKK